MFGRWSRKRALLTATKCPCSSSARPISTNPRSAPPNPSATSEAKLRELGDAFAKLATGTHSEYLSLFGVVPETSLLKDGVHPDAAGNAAIAKVMANALSVPAR